jgi:copper transport protein
VSAERTAGRRRTRRRRLVSAVAVAALLIAVDAPTAAAHSLLVSTDPGNDVVVEQSPERVVLRFDEPVEMSLGGIRVFDDDARRVDTGQVTPSSGPIVSTGIRGTLAPGTYTVAWRAISADSDPISGAFVFHVQRRSEAAAGLSLDSLTGTSAAVDVAFTASRFLELGLIVLCIGGSAAMLFVLTSASWPVRRWLFGVLAGCGLALSLVALLNIVFEGASASGLGFGDGFSWEVFDAVLDLRYGHVMLIQAALAAALAVTALALRLGGGRETMLAGMPLALCAGLAITPAASGHASTAGTLALVSDVAHVVTAGLWAGGLAFLTLALVRSPGKRWELAARAVPPFSRLAVGSVAILAVAGVTTAYLQVRTWSGLWEAKYGLLVLTKIILALPILFLAAFNNRVAVPRLKAGITSPAEQRRFLIAVSYELGLVVAILAVTAVLVNTEPARLEALGAGHPTAGAPARTATVDLGQTEAIVLVDPARAGTNRIQVVLTNHELVFDVTAVTVAASLPRRDLGPLEFPAELDSAQHGVYTAEDAQLALPGDWDLRVEVRVGESELLTETTTVTIAP